MGATGRVAKSANDSGANDSSIDAAVMAVASAAKDSAVVEAAATRATKAAIASVSSVLAADVDAPAAGDVGSAIAAGAEEAGPVGFADGVPTVGVGDAADERPAEEATAAAGADGEEALADELPGRVGRGGGFAAGGGAAAGAGRAGGTVGIAAFGIGLLTVAVRGVALGLAPDGVAGRFMPGEPAVAPEGSWGADDAECEADTGD